jgi:23S rRNA (pseudouridine1915-N3)-methyltransferase
MLSLHIITVGREKDHWISEQIDHFRKLISKYAQIELTAVTEAKYSKKANIAKALTSEAKAIKSVLKGGYLFILDVEGETFATDQLAQKIDRLQVDGNSLLEFVIGGPYGLSPELKLKRKKENSCILNISPMTLSHQISRLVLLEQLYRVLNLNAGGTYHK